jgi:predicted DNA-binding ribbon-helix-helix protein
MVKERYTVTLEEAEVEEALRIYNTLYESTNLSSFINSLITNWLKKQNSLEGRLARKKILEKKLEELEKEK